MGCVDFEALKIEPENITALASLSDIYEEGE
jgi:hypothetical protein